MRTARVATFFFFLGAGATFGQGVQTPIRVAAAQQPARQEHQGMRHNHGQSPASHGNQPPPESESPGSMAQAPELLAETGKRPPMKLSDFEALANSNNPTLLQANQIVRRSAGQARQAGLLPNPSIGYQGEEIRGGSRGGGEQGGFVQQNIVLGGKLGLRRKVAEGRRKEDEIGVSEQRYRVLSDLRQAYYSALAAQETVKLRRRLMRLALDAVQTAHQLANVGQADSPDVLQAEVEAEQAKVEYATAQRVYIQNFRALSALAGQPALPLSPLEGALEGPPRIDADRILSEILSDSPSVKRAQQAVVVAETQIRSAKREAVPDLQLRAGLEQNLEPLSEMTARPVGVQGFATAGITIPLFNRNQGNVQAAQAELERARQDVTRVELSLRQTAEPFLQMYLAEQLQAERYKSEMIPRALRAYQLYLDRYSHMAAAYPQVIISQRTLFQIQVAYIQTLERLWRHAIALQNFTLTGGLDAPTASGSGTTTINLPNSGGSPD